MLREVVQDKLDILLFSETKVDPSFLSSQCAIEGFSFPFRLDRNSSGGGIMLSFSDEIPSKALNSIQTKQLSWKSIHRNKFVTSIMLLQP